MTDLAAHMPAVAQNVACALLGEPEEKNGTKWRFGRYSLDLSSGQFYDFDLETRLDVIDLIAREKLTDRDGATEWLGEFAPETLNGHAPKRLPDDLADERALIGLILVRPAVLALAEEEIGASDFIAPLHARIFAVFCDARDNAYETDVKTLVAALGGDNAKEVAPGYTLWRYVAHLAASAPIVTEEQAPDLARLLARDIRQGADVERGNFDAVAETGYEPEPPKPFVSKFGAIRWHEQDAAGHQTEWGIKKLIPRRCKVMIVGAKQSGKSFWTEGAALAMARGVDFFGRRVPKPVGVIYGAAEAGASFRDRMKAYRQANGLSLDPLSFAVLTQEFNLFNAEQDVENLIAECLALGAEFSAPLGVVVIDTYNAVTPGIDENSAGEVSKVIAKINMIMRRTGADVWLVHHKNALGGIRGSTALSAAFDTVVEISRVVGLGNFPERDANRREKRNARVMFQRVDEEGETFDFVLRKVAVSKDQDGDDITSCVIEPPTEPEGAPKSSTGFVFKSDNAHASYKALIEALGERGGKPPAGQSAKAPARAIVVHRDYWRDTLLRSSIGSKHDDPAQRAAHVKKVLQRAMDKLAQWGLIGVDYPWVWRTTKKVAGYDPPPHAYSEMLQEAQPFEGDDELSGQVERQETGQNS